MRAGLLVPVLALAALAACGKPASKKVTVASTSDATQAIVDDDYRFRLDWPGAGWKLLDEQEVQNMCPDAAAGAFRETGLFGVVIVESAPEAELEAFAGLILDNMALEGKRVELLERTTYVGKEAMRCLVTGMMQGIRFVYGGMIFLHDDHAYQVLAWCRATGPPDFAHFRPFHDAFHLTEGAVLGRRRSEEVKDARGMGWRVAGGAFESGVTGIRVAPALPWRVVVGGELEQMNSAAEVGLLHQSPDVYAVLIPERAPPAGREALERQLRDAVAESLGVAAGEEGHTLRVSGEEVKLAVFSTESPARMEFLHGICSHRDQVVQVLAWYSPAKREEARALLRGALGSVEFLGAERAKALREELLAVPDPENDVGTGWSLRSGVYRDFARGIEWTKPPGFWRVKAGDRARAENEDATLHVAEPERGLAGLLILEDGEGWSGEDYHATVAEFTFEGDAPEPVAGKIDGVPALVSEGDRDIDGVRFRFRLATTVRADIALQFLVWAYPEFMKRESAAVDAVIDGVRFHATDPQREEGGRFEELRFGYAIRPPAGWLRKDSTPAGTGSVASFTTWGSGGDMLGVLVLCAIAEGQDETWFMNLIDQILRDRYQSLMRREPEESECTVSGRKARRVTWRGPGETVEVDLVLRERTIYALLAAGRNSRRAPLEAARRTFVLLD